MIEGRKLQSPMTIPFRDIHMKHCLLKTVLECGSHQVHKSQRELVLVENENKCAELTRAFTNYINIIFKHTILR